MWQLCCLLLLLGIQQVQAESGSILVITSSDAELYTRFSDSFEMQYKALTGKPGARINKIRLNENGQLPGSVPADTIMTVSVGTKTAHAVNVLELATPVLYTLIPASIYQSLLPLTVPCARQSAIFIDQPVARQAQLAQAIFPQAKTYGVLLGPTSGRHRDTLEALAVKSDWRLVIKEVAADSEPEWKTRELVDETDLIIAINDPHALNRNNAKWLLYSAYQHRNPVIGFSRAYAKAGAAASVFSTPEQIGKQAAEFISQHEKDDRKCMTAPEFPAYFKVIINSDVTHSLGGREKDETELLKSIAEDEKVNP